MARFEPAFQKTMKNEGGYQLHEVPGDRGGQTYAGISRRWHPNWPGWRLIDSNRYDERLTAAVRSFYKEQYWNKISGDEIKSQAVAETIFDFAVNAGRRVGVKLAQLVVGATPDGVMGPKTLEAINGVEDDKLFVGKYFIAKIARYAGICNEDHTQEAFLLGWTNRALKGVM